MIRQARAADIEPAWSASQVEEELAWRSFPMLAP
jgi:hypothetical protein